MIGIYTDSFIKRTCLICNIKEFSAELPSTRTQHHRPPQVVCDFQHRILPLAPTSRLSQQTCMDSAWDWKAELGEFRPHQSTWNRFGRGIQKAQKNQIYKYYAHASYWLLFKSLLPLNLVFPRESL